MVHGVRNAPLEQHVTNVSLGPHGPEHHAHVSNLNSHPISSPPPSYNMYTISILYVFIVSISVI